MEGHLALKTSTFKTVASSYMKHQFWEWWSILRVISIKIVFNLVLSTLNSIEKIILHIIWTEVTLLFRSFNPNSLKLSLLHMLGKYNKNIIQNSVITWKPKNYISFEISKCPEYITSFLLLEMESILYTRTKLSLAAFKLLWTFQL